MIARFAFVLLFLASQVQGAEIHQWRDANGNLHFSDSPPPNSQSRRVEVEPNVYSPVALPAPEPSSSEVVAAKPPITMYSAEWCGVCKTARRYFEDNGVAFKEFDIETTRKGERDYARLGGGGIPLILIGGKRMQGFHPPNFERMYNEP